MPAGQPPEWALYLRKSRGRAGIARQRTITTAHIHRQGGTIGAEFADTDRTAFQRTGGARPVRERFDDMIAWLRTRPGAGVAAWHADRLLRNPADTELLIETCAAGGHLVETPRGGSYDLSTATGRKRLRDDANQAAYEVDHSIERITAAKLEAVAAGEDLGGRRRFGWHKRSDGFGVLAAEAELIASGTRSVIAGASLASLARSWNTAGVTTTTGNPWTPSEVRRTLLRARNAGLLEHHGQVTGPGTGWAAVVSEAEWRACRAILTDPARRDTPGPGRRWLLSGIAECGACGDGTTVIVTYSGGKGRAMRPVYRDRPRGRPSHVARDVRSLDDWVEGAVIEIMRRQDIPLHVPDLTHLHAELAAVQGELKELARAVGQRKMNATRALLATQPLEEAERDLQERIGRAMVPHALAPFAGRDPVQAWAAMSLEQHRAVVKGLMRVVIQPSRRGHIPGARPGGRYFDKDAVDLVPLDLHGPIP